MEVKLAVIADAANVSREGKLNILGEFNTIFAATVPIRWPVMVLVVKLEAPVAEGPEHAFGVRVVDEDGNFVAPNIDGRITFGGHTPPGHPYRAQQIIGIRDAVFPKFGEYAFEILCDGRREFSVPLYVQERAPAVPALPPPAE